MTISNLSITEIILSVNVTFTMDVCVLPNLCNRVKLYEGLIRFHIGSPLASKSIFKILLIAS